MTTLLLSAFAAVLLLAATSDLLHFRIPNAMVAVVLLLYPVWVVFSPQPQAWPIALGIFAGTLVIALFAFRFGLLGAGDGKLLAAVLLWAGPAYSATALLIMAVAGGVLALLYGTVARFALAGAVERLGGVQLRNNLLANRLPYGIAIAAGGIHFALGQLARIHGF